MEQPKRETRPTPEEQSLKGRLIRSGGAKRGKTGRISDDFWDLPWPEDPDGLLLKALLEDREQGR
ncbi:MAG: hypothetical protein AVDCRST_MAG02-3202 [uncultured Rubrobacteraceae bacterium]|uniref:Uncharacterized protein n=1 Tax=uncultured Rubrobacteraceae bacterium TaxID=349277 RepID=A0A6J4RGD8_9ACTN|nr:MAG: hypothetical protein AVDCRST_MAG02-3202 [uncultured Rubrobacteraceae bacterium]